MRIGFPPQIRLLLSYLLLGPLLGALLGFLWFNLQVVLPDWWYDPSNQYGHDRWHEYFATLALMIFFSYPIGLAPALLAYFTHLLLRPRLPMHRWLCIALIGLTAALSEACFIKFAAIAFIDSVESAESAPTTFLTVISLCCALIIAFACSRDHAGSQAQT